MVLKNSWIIVWKLAKIEIWEFSAGMPMQPYPRAQYPEGYSQSSTQSPAKTRVRNGPVLQSQTGGNFHRAFENIEKENSKLLKMLSLV